MRIMETSEVPDSTVYQIQGRQGLELPVDLQAWLGGCPLENRKENPPRWNDERYDITVGMATAQ